MAAPVYQKEFIQDIRQDVRVRSCGGLMFTGDALADTIRVSMYDGSTPYAISGTVVMNCIRADGATVPVTGSVSGNVAQATLTQACCAISGPLTVVMKVTSGSVTSTILKAVYTVDVGETGTVVDPGTIIPDVAALISAIETAVGSIPADYSALLSTIAPNYDDLTYPLVAGKTYCWHGTLGSGGALYKAKVDIPSAETWTAGHWESVVITSDIGALINIVNSKIKKWDVATNGKIVFLGNSYGKYSGPDGEWGPETGKWDLWPQVVASLLNLGTEGTNWWNVCQPTHSLAAHDESKRFMSDYIAWVTAHRDELDNIGAVICVAGLNDSDGTMHDYIQPYIDLLINAVKVTCPNAKVYFGYTGFLNESINQFQHTGHAEGRNDVLKEYQRCPQFGGIYLSGVENILHRKEYLYTDGIHPNLAGSALLGCGVVNALLQGYAPYYGNGEGTVYALSGSAYYNSGNAIIAQDVADGVLCNKIRMGLNYGGNGVTPPEWQIGHEYAVATVTLPYTNSQILGDFTAEIITSDNTGVLATIRAQIIARRGQTDTMYFKIIGYSDGALTHTVKEMRQVTFDVTKYLQLDDEITVEQEAVSISSPVATTQETLAYLGIS